MTRQAVPVGILGEAHPRGTSTPRALASQRSGAHPKGTSSGAHPRGTSFGAPHAALRAEAVRELVAWQMTPPLPALHDGSMPPDVEQALDALRDEVRVVFVSVPAAARFRMAEQVAQRGVHVFLEWPPAASIREGEALVALAEEAGVEIGVSRPLRFHPLAEALSAGAQPARAQPHLITLRQTFGGGEAVDWTARMAEAVDLCCALARSSNVRRVGAGAARGSGARLEAGAFGLRFHNGAYAQVSLRRPVGAGDAEGRLFVAGAGFRGEADLAGGAACLQQGDKPPVARAAAGPEQRLRRETRAFVEAVAAGRPAPVSALDALHTLRLVERLMQQLR